jgi:F0F1-type ATP synthase assembly protein I
VEQHDDGQPTISASTLVGLGGFLVGCVVAGLIVGWLADEHCGSSPVGILIGIGCGVVIGIAGSCVQVVHYLRR